MGIKNINILWFLYIFLGFAAMVYSYIFVIEKREKFLDNGEKFNIKNLLHIDEISKVFIEKIRLFLLQLFYYLLFLSYTNFHCISIAFYAGAVSLLFELILFFAINKIRKYEYSG